MAMWMVMWKITTQMTIYMTIYQMTGTNDMGGVNNDDGHGADFAEGIMVIMNMLLKACNDLESDK